MTVLREVSDEFILWTIGGEDVGREMQLALQQVQSHPNSSMGCTPKARCMHVGGPELPEGPVHAIFATIDYGTWARGRHQSPSGPPVVRNSEFPWGLPHLQGTARVSIELENQRLRDVLRLLHQASTKHPETRLFFVFPEFLGIAARGCPASPWQLQELRRWASNEGWCRYALYQCELHEEPHRFPLGLLTSESFNSRRCYRGWPRIRKHDGKYVGPLPIECSCNNTHNHATSTATHRDSPPQAIRPGFLCWLWRKLLKVGHLRSGESEADQQEARSSSGGETWLESSSPSPSASSSPLATPRASSGSSTPSGTSADQHLGEDHELAVNLGLSDERDTKESVLNVTAKDDQNYMYQAPTVKARAER